jgi:hypothetical protein
METFEVSTSIAVCDIYTAPRYFTQQHAHYAFIRVLGAINSTNATLEAACNPE